MAAAVRARLEKGIPAHVTLCYPFMPPEQVDDELTERLKALFRRAAPFPFRFARTDRFPATLWLAPEPWEPFRDISETLGATFPSLRPYGGRFDRVIPHLTVADRVTEPTMDRLEAAIVPLLPVEAEATEAWLMEGDDDGWVLRQAFPLGERSQLLVSARKSPSGGWKAQAISRARDVISLHSGRDGHVAGTAGHQSGPVPVVQRQGPQMRIQSLRFPHHRHRHIHVLALPQDPAVMCATCTQDRALGQTVPGVATRRSARAGPAR